MKMGSCKGNWLWMWILNTVRKNVVQQQCCVSEQKIVIKRTAYGFKKTNHF